MKTQSESKARLSNGSAARPMTNERDANPLMPTLARRARDGWAMATLAMVSACGASVETSEDLPELGTLEAAFKDVNGNDAFEFIAEMPPVEGGNNQTGGFDPALCSNSGHAGFIFVRDTEDFVQTYNYSGANPDGWTRYGNGSGQASPKTFAGRLSCTAAGFSGAKFVLAGRGKADNLLYWSAGTVDDAQSNPYSDSNRSFSLVDSSNTYSSSPAVASHDGQVILTVIGNDGQLYAYYKNPNASWSTRVQGPSISGWTLQGTPAVTYMEGAEQYHIYVRATRTWRGITITRFHRAYFTIDRFSGPFSLFSPLMEAVNLVQPRPQIDSDPAVEWTGAAYDPGGLENVITLYYRSGDKFHQTSGFPYPEEHPLELVTSSGNNPDFTGTPSVQGGVPYEVGQHWFVGQDTSNTIWFGSSQNDGNLIE